jgi:hypothetical protein
MISTCPASAKSMIPSAIGMSSCSGEFVLITPTRALLELAASPWAMRIIRNSPRSAGAARK